MVQFANLNFLWMLWLIPCVIVFQIWAGRRKNFLLEQFVSPELKAKLLAHFSFRRQRTKEVLFALALVFTILALIRPRYGFHWEEVTRKGVDIMIALDVSKSMLAEDVSPSRLERAKREILDLINIVQGDRLGLIAFAGTSFLQCPLTLDYGAVEIFLDELDTDLIPVPGTAIADAINKAAGSFDPANPNAKALILITDGEDHLADPVAAAKKAAEKNIRIYAIGIGKEGGAPIPDPSGGFKKNSQGEVILSKLDEESLQKIALASGGSYVRSTSGNLDFEKIYKDIKSSIEDRELASGRKKRYEERYQWPLSLAIILLIIEMVMRENLRARAKDRQPSRLRRFWVPKIFMLILAGLAALSWQPKAMALFDTSKAEEGEDAYEEGNYPEALKNLLDAQIESPANLKLKYNLGNVYYRLEDYSNAEKMYSEVAKGSDPELVKKAQYNLGNTAFKQGKLKEALDHYQAALALDPQDKDAAHNIEVVRREIKKRLEEQKKRQEQQQNQQQEQNQNQDGQDKKDSEQDQNKDGDKKEGQEDKQKQGQQNDQDKKDGEDKKGDQEQKQAGQDKDKKEQEQEQKQAGEQQQDKKPEQDEKQQGSGNAGQEQQDEAKEMSEEEAERWLSTLKNDRKEYLKKKLQGEGSSNYRMEKDW